MLNPPLLSSPPYSQVSAVVVGYDKHFNLMKLMKACSYLRHPSCHFIATNEDSCLPTNTHILFPGQVSCDCTLMSCDCTLMSCDCVFMSCDCTLMSCDCTLISCDCTLMSCDCILMSCDCIFMSCDYTLMSCDCNSFHVTVSSCHVTVSSCHVTRYWMLCESCCLW